MKEWYESISSAEDLEKLEELRIAIFGKKGDKKMHQLIDRVGDVKGLAIARIVLFPLEDLINYVS